MYALLTNAICTGLRICYKGKILPVCVTLKKTFTKGKSLRKVRKLICSLPLHRLSEGTVVMVTCSAEEKEEERGAGWLAAGHQWRWSPSLGLLSRATLTPPAQRPKRYYAAIFPMALLMPVPQ